MESPKMINTIYAEETSFLRYSFWKEFLDKNLGQQSLYYTITVL